MRDTAIAMVAPVGLLQFSGTVRKPQVAPASRRSRSWHLPHEIAPACGAADATSTAVSDVSASALAPAIAASLRTAHLAGSNPAWWPGWSDYAVPRAGFEPARPCESG